MKNEYDIRGEVTAIFLKRKDGTILETLIDTSDLEKAKSFEMTWYASWDSHTSSYYCGGGLKAIARKQKKVKLHRFLLDCPEGRVVDHLNRDTLDNRRSNLRITDHATNAQNRKNVKTNTSGIKGVSWSSWHNKWTVSFRVRGKTHFFGRYSDLEYAKNLAVSEYEKLTNSKLPY